MTELVTGGTAAAPAGRGDTSWPTVGVEEEYLLVDPASRGPGNVASRVVEGTPDHLTSELKSSMLEVRTEPVVGLDDVRAEVLRVRADALAAAGTEGAMLAAAGTLPLFDWRDIDLTAEDRYREIRELGGRVAEQAVVCACHVHVEVDDLAAAVDVSDRARPWLSVLLALSASSPFWRDERTGYASYRAIVWDRWPISGPPPLFRTGRRYEETAEALVGTGVVLDRKQLYWDLRPSDQQPTIEFRAADANPSVDVVVLLAALSRALVVTCRREAVDGVAVPDPPPGLLAAARWRAARSGLAGDLVDPVSGQSAPAATVVGRLVSHLSRALAEIGDLAEVERITAELFHQGTSAARQLEVLRRTGSLEAVVDDVVEATRAGVPT